MLYIYINVSVIMWYISKMGKVFKTVGCLLFGKFLKIIKKRVFGSEVFALITYGGTTMQLSVLRRRLKYYFETNILVISWRNSGYFWALRILIMEEINTVIGIFSYDVCFNELYLHFHSALLKFQTWFVRFKSIQSGS